MTNSFGLHRRRPRSPDYVAPSLRGERKLKIWVPQPVFEAMTLVAGERDESRPSLIRRILFTHLFGRAVLEDLLEPRSEVLYSRRARDSNEPTLPLGKSIADALVQVSGDVHDGLRVLAERHRQPLGTYAAYVLCWAMFGRGVNSVLAMRVTQGMWLGDEHDEPGNRETEP